MKKPIFEVREKDLAMIAELEKQCFSDPWSLRTIEDAFRQKDYFIYVWRDMKRVSGYVIGRLAADEGELLRVGVLPFIRNFGIGARLVCVLQEELTKRVVSAVYLEVRESNKPAIRMYKKRGFIVQGRRPKYYRNPLEDAVLMRWDVPAQSLPVVSEEEPYYNETHKEENEMKCNLCGRSMKEKEDFFKGEKEWGYFSGKDLECHEFFLCEHCYDELVKKFKIPVSVKEKKEVLT